LDAAKIFKGMLFASSVLSPLKLSQRFFAGGLIARYVQPLVPRMTKKLNKYANRSQISADIDRLFPDHKNLVIENGNFAWTKAQEVVARNKGIRFNTPCRIQPPKKSG
tara:strand:+ start:1159 stop:1482 length:324 start_codon:yes stop_codon:yes gene_type:complete